MGRGFQSFLISSHWRRIGEFLWGFPSIFMPHAFSWLGYVSGQGPYIEGSFSGRTRDYDSRNDGSNPSPSHMIDKTNRAISCIA